MLTTRIDDLLPRLRTGSAEPADITVLERTKASDLLAELVSDYSLRFQERRVGEKWELGLARSLRHELSARVPCNSSFPIVLLIPVLRSCLLLSGEGDRVTGVVATTRLSVKPCRTSSEGLALTTGGGFKLEQAPDGWAVKPLRKRTVKLTEEFLRRRGWHFELLWQFVAGV